MRFKLTKNHEGQLCIEDTLGQMHVMYFNSTLDLLQCEQYLNLLNRDTAYVIMGNDYPDSVFTDEVAANKYVEKKKAEDLATRGKDQAHLSGFVKVYWRSYKFDLRS